MGRVGAVSSTVERHSLWRSPFLSLALSLCWSCVERQRGGRLLPSYSRPEDSSVVCLSPLSLIRLCLLSLFSLSPRKKERKKIEDGLTLKKLFFKKEKNT